MSSQSPLVDRDFLFNACIKTYPNDVVKYTVFNKPIFNPEKREIVKRSIRFNRSKSPDSVSRCDSLKRSKDKVFDISFANAQLWQYMITLTLDSKVINRYDKKEINKKLKIWLSNLVQRNNANYLIIPEYHSDGAIHFHGLIAGDFKLEFSGKHDKTGRPIYNILDWKYGFSTCVCLDDNRVSVCSYITKYITKSADRILGNVYYCGGSSIVREVPRVYQNIDFNSFNGKLVEVPNTNVMVKYSMVGYMGG